MLNCLNPIINIQSEILLKNINQLRKKEKRELIKSFSYYNDWNNKECEFLANSARNYKDVEFFKCRKCITCKLFKSYDWLKRIDIERQKWKYLFFITLTFDKQHIKKNEFESRELSKWFKKQKRAGNLPENFAYIAAAEYGEHTGRKHYHILLMLNEFLFYDLQEFKKSKRGNMIYTSNYLNSLWENGEINSVQIVKNESCFKYILKYTTKLKNKGEKLIKSRYFGKPINPNILNVDNLPVSLVKAQKQKNRYWEKKLQKGECSKRFFNEKIIFDKYNNLILKLGKQKSDKQRKRFWDENIYNSNNIKSNYYHNWNYYNHKATEL